MTLNGCHLRSDRSALYKQFHTLRETKAPRSHFQCRLLPGNQRHPPAKAGDHCSRFMSHTNQGELVLKISGSSYVSETNRPLNGRVKQVQVRMDVRTIPYRPKPGISVTESCGPSGLFSPGEPNAPGYSATLSFWSSFAGPGHIRDASRQNEQRKAFT